MKPTLPSRFSPGLRNILLASSLAWAVSGAHAAIITLSTDIPVGQNWNSTSGGFTYWSDNLAVSAGNDYVVGVDRLLRTPGTGTSFAGDSLTLQGQFNLTATSGNQTWTVNNLILSSGSLIGSASANGSTQSLSGSISVENGTAFVKSTGTTGTGASRNITFNSVISGGPGATLHFLRQGTFSLTNTANLFGGTWKAGGTSGVGGITGADVTGTGVAGNDTATNFTDQYSVIKATAAGALGVNANVILDAYGRLDADFDWATSGTLTLNLNGQIVFDQNLTVGNMFINGNQIGAGTYTLSNFTAMDAGYASYFTGGTGLETITVIPEPAPVGLAFLGLGLISVYRRRVTCRR